MSATGLFLPVRITHRIAAAFQFVDFFTQTPVTSKLTVSVPALKWEAFANDGDKTYRFVSTNREVPAGVFAVAVTAPGGEYLAKEPISLTLPIIVGHPPPVIAADYLISQPLWPTRVARASAGETAITGRIQTGGGTVLDGLRIFIFTGAIPVSPYAYVDKQGEFLSRLPQAKTFMSGGTVVTHSLFSVECRDPANTVVPISPASIDLVFGSTQNVSFTVP